MKQCTGRTRSRRGFTLIELMIVVVIIGILAAIAVPRFERVSRSAKEAEAASILKQLFTLQERYKQRNEVFAENIGDLEGAAASFTSAKYYDFEISDGDGTTYLACAKPRAGYVLSYFTINSDRVITPKESGCT